MLHYIRKFKSLKNTNVANEALENQQAVVINAGADFFENKQSEYIGVYNRILKLCKDALLDYYENDDHDLLDRKIDRINERIIQGQSPATKQLINTYAKKELNKELSKIDRKANEIILKLA